MYYMIRKLLNEEDLSYMVGLPNKPTAEIQTNPENKHKHEWYIRKNRSTSKVYLSSLFEHQIVQEKLEKKIKTLFEGDIKYHSEYGIPAGFRLTRYDIGDSIHIHKDEIYENDGEMRMTFNDNEYTAVVLLNDEFEGGDFYIDRIRLPLKAGDAVIFSRECYHEVKKIISGTRYSFAIWFDMV